MVNENITVSEDRLGRILADFKLELFKMIRDELAKKADASDVEALATRVGVIETHGSREAQLALKRADDQQDAIEALNTWKVGLAVVTALLTLVLATIAPVVLSHYLP